jgi:thioredoxin 2
MSTTTIDLRVGDQEVVSAPLVIAQVSEFDELVASSDVPVLVDYWAPWCGPCRMVAPELKKVASSQAGKLVVAKVNVDEVPELAERYGIRSIPTLAVFHGGREVARSVGAGSASAIERFVQQAVGN